MNNAAAALMLNKYVPNFVKNFVDEGKADILAVEDMGDHFIVLSFDVAFQECFMVGVILKLDKEEDCFVDVHKCYDDYLVARKAYIERVKFHHECRV